MRLNELIASNATLTRPEPAVETVPRPAIDTGFNLLKAEFFTPERTIRGELSTSESRLSDHLNGSNPTVELKPHYVAHGSEGALVDLVGTIARINKDRLLFAVPISEPERPAGTGKAWKPTVKRQCWAGLGPYKISGTLHNDPGYDARAALRLLEKQFLPITDASVTRPDGQVDHYPAVFINREHVDVLALKESW